MLKISLVLVSTLLINSLVWAHSIYPLTVRQEAQFQHLLRELRCLECQNQNLADSNAQLAKDMRFYIYNRVKAGTSDQEIIESLTSRYGDFILFNPPLKSLTLFLWFGPIFLLLLGLIIFWRSCVGRKPHA